MEDNDKSTSSQDTVTINVGGKHYEVSVALVEQNPESMLARLTSDMWRKNPTKPIFIDRDGGIFAHVLNYLRYGSIELPNDLPTSMFERELDFYGISIQDTCIQQSTSVGTMKLIKQNICDAELHHDMLLIAATCNCQFMAGRQTVHIRNREIHLKHNPYFYDEKTAMNTLNCYLKQFYGLKAAHCKQLFASDLDFVLKVNDASEVDGGDNQESTPKRPPSRFSSAPFDELFTPFGSPKPGTDGGAQVTPLRASRGEMLSEDEFLRALDRALMTP